MKFSHFILRKIIKFVATRYQILRLKCTQFNFDLSSAPDPARELTALLRPLAGFKGSTFKGVKGKEWEMGGEGGVERVEKGKEGEGTEGRRGKKREGRDGEGKGKGRKKVRGGREKEVEGGEGRGRRGRFTPQCSKS